MNDNRKKGGKFMVLPRYRIATHSIHIPPAQSEYLKYLKAIIMAQLLCRNIVISHKQQYNKHK